MNKRKLFIIFGFCIIGIIILILVFMLLVPSNLTFILNPVRIIDVKGEKYIDCPAFSGYYSYRANVTATIQNMGIIDVNVRIKIIVVGWDSKIETVLVKAHSNLNVTVNLDAGYDNYYGNETTIKYQAEFLK